MSGSSMSGIRVLGAVNPYIGKMNFVMRSMPDDPNRDKNFSPAKYLEQGNGLRVLGAYNNWPLRYEPTLGSDINTNKWMFVIRPEGDLPGKENGSKVGIKNPIALRIPLPGEEPLYASVSLSNPRVAVSYNF